MFAPGLISAFFYRRRPTRLQVALGVIFTVVVSALLGYIQDAGTSRVWENATLAAILGLALYAGILLYLVYVYFPAKERSAVRSPPSASPPHP